MHALAKEPTAMTQRPNGHGVAIAALTLAGLISGLFSSCDFFLFLTRLHPMFSCAISYMTFLSVAASDWRFRRGCFCGGCVRRRLVLPQELWRGVGAADHARSTHSAGAGVHLVDYTAEHTHNV